MQLYIMMAASGRAYSLTRLATIMKCSRQTILRMIEQIQRIPGVECQTWLDKHERYYQIAGHSPPTDMLINADALRHLALCRDIVTHLLPESLQRELDQTLHGMAADGQDKPPTGLALAQPWVKGRIDYTPFQDVIEDIQAALRARQLCRIAYQARSTGRYERLLAAPLLIIAYREALYLRCRLHETAERHTDAYRLLAIHRIKSLRLVPTTFKDIPEDHNDPHFGFPIHEPLQVRVAFWGGAATYVQERVWSPDQQLRKRRKGVIELTFTTTSRFEVVSWVLGFGPEAELLEPKDLREEIKKKAEEIAGQYSTEKRKGRKRQQ